MASLADIRTALADTVSTALPAVTGYRKPDDNPAFPCFIVAGFDIEPSNTSGGRQVTAVCWVAVAGDELEELDALVDDSNDSVWTAIDNSPTLGGVVDYLVIESVGDFRDIEVAGTKGSAATVRVQLSA